jgi:hypothetical protein
MSAITTRITDTVAGSGTITSTTSSPTVTGIGTSFTTETVVGYILKTTGGATIGTVATINSDTNITLSVNATANTSSDSYIILPSGATLKNAPLNNPEIDTNFLRLNVDKLERSKNLSDLPSAITARANLGLTLGSQVQAFDVDLSALSSLTTTGLIVRTGNGTAVTRSLTGSTNEILIGNADGVAGDVSVTIGSNIPRLNAAGNVFSGDITAANFNATSDMALKHNIEPVLNAIDTVKLLEGKSFRWNSTGKDSFGVMAQEVEKILPQLVEEDNGIKSVNYLGLIAFLINAVKELNDKIENK